MLASAQLFQAGEQTKEPSNAPICFATKALENVAVEVQEQQEPVRSRGMVVVEGCERNLRLQGQPWQSCSCFTSSILNSSFECHRACQGLLGTTNIAAATVVMVMSIMVVGSGTSLGSSSWRRLCARSSLRIGHPGIRSQCGRLLQTAAIRCCLISDDMDCLQHLIAQFGPEAFLGWIIQLKQGFDGRVNVARQVLLLVAEPLPRANEDLNHQRV